mgnify:CR=1 FL=1|tara:strand:+ start:299 stop:415 length:117 start_codon:yes stop_codon:yes gene_type:complete
MEALYAGLSAWSIEIGIVLLVLFLLKNEENKVFKNRKK